jgi:hypothetical protein
VTFDPTSLLGRLVEGDVDFVVIGGLAATIHGAALPTVDLDVMYERTPPNLERLAGVLQRLSVRLRDAEEVNVEVDARLLKAGDRFTFTSPLGALDIFGSAEGALSYAQVRRDALRVRVGTYTVSVASLNDLIAMKRATGRPKDAAKLAELIELRKLAEGPG